jgi:hypothetical protein
LPLVDGRAAQSVAVVIDQGVQVVDVHRAVVVEVSLGPAVEVRGDALAVVIDQGVQVIDG